MDPKISIIVPVYNAEKYLKECIHSILNQDYENIELILVNDGSKDKSLEICRCYESDKVIVINKTNEGVSKARNDGIKTATGNYIAFVDADDSLPEYCISSLFKSLTQTKVDFAFGPSLYNYDGKLVKHKLRLSPGTYLIEELLDIMIDDGTLSGFLLGRVWGALYKKQIIDDYNLHFHREINLNEDGVFNIEYALHANSIAIVERPIYYYRQYGTSTTKTFGKDIRKYNQQIVEYIKNLNLNKEIHQLDKQLSARNVSLAFWEIIGISHSYSLFKGTRLIRELLKRNDVKEGIRYLDLPQMNNYKRILAILMNYNQAFALYFLLKYLYPLACKILAR